MSVVDMLQVFGMFINRFFDIVGRFLINDLGTNRSYKCRRNSALRHGWANIIRISSVPWIGHCKKREYITQISRGMLAFLNIMFH